MPSARLRSRPSAKVVIEQRQRRRREQRTAEPLEGAKADQRCLRPGDPAEQRARREEDESPDEEAAPTEQVGEPAPEQQRAAEEDRVRRDDPLQARRREKPRSVLIDGRATLTIATSRMTMNCAVTISASAAQRRLAESVVMLIN